MADNLILKKGESTWYVRLAVPADVQKAIGCKVLIQSLKTGLRREAMVLRLAILDEWKADIKAARLARQLNREGWQDKVHTKAGLQRQRADAAFIDAIRNPPSGSANPTVESVRQSLFRLEYEKAVLLEQVKLHERETGAEGLSTRIEAHFNAPPETMAGGVQFADQLTQHFISEHARTEYSLSSAEQVEANSIIGNPATYKSRSPITAARLQSFREFRESRGGASKHVDQQVGKMERLSAFMKKDGLPLTFDTVDVWLKSLDRAPATLGQYLMAGTAFWKWAIKYDAAWHDQFKDKMNPFIGHDLPQGGGSETAGKDREIYSRADALKLHQAALDNDDKPLAGLIACGWFTGARIEELCLLNKDSVITVDGIKCFDFPRSKSKASKRVVPIHPSLLATVDRLREGSTDSFLILAESADKYGKRSHAISKAFGRLRTAAGFSKLHVFHSFRHTVVTELIRSDVPDALAKELVGHETGSVTHDVYSKGASTTQKLAAISKLSSLF